MDARIQNLPLEPWVAEQTHAIAGCIPLLTLDKHENACHWDFGAAAVAHVHAFMQNIDWAPVHERDQKAVTGSSGALRATAEAAAGAKLLDVRRAGVVEQSDVLAEGVEWRDTAPVDVRAEQRPPDTPVVVCCGYGHEVGRSTALRLRAAGVDARFLIDGFDGWRSHGRPVSTQYKG